MLFGVIIFLMKKSSLQGKIAKKTKMNRFITYKKSAKENNLKYPNIRVFFRKKNIFFRTKL